MNAYDVRENGKAIDFETYYSTKVSIKKLSNYNYTHHPEAVPYLVAIHDSKHTEVTEPKLLDWSQCHGKILIAHNVSFDSAVFHRLQTMDGVIPADVQPKAWLDSADLAVYLGAPRNLSGASLQLLGEPLDKGVRDRAKNKTVEQIKKEGWWDEMLKYGATDAVMSYRLMLEYIDQWPEVEQKVSAFNRMAGDRGLFVDAKYLQECLDKLTVHLHTLESAIPWYNGEDGPALLSKKEFNALGTKLGLRVPKSLAKSDAAAAEFFEEHAKNHPWIQAFRDWRRVNALYQRLLAVKKNLKDDGFMPYQCKYFGAQTTGRFSGGGDSGGRFNVQNMPRDEMFGVNLRHLFKAPPGFKYGIIDYSQIEARLLLWRAGDLNTLQLIQDEGYSVYEAHARASMGWTGGSLKKEDPVKYLVAKVRCLGGGYSIGFEKYAMFAKPMLKPEEFDAIFRVPVSEANLAAFKEELKRRKWGPVRLARMFNSPDLTAFANSWLQVTEYRASNPLIVQYWKKHKLWFEQSVLAGDKTHEFELASGRTLRYYNPHAVMVKDENGESMRQLAAEFDFPGTSPKRIWHGILVENEIQATARDVLRDAWVALVEAGFDVAFTVHDEIIVHLPEATAKEDLKRVEHIMCSSSPWAKGCPLAVEGHLADHYLK